MVLSEAKKIYEIYKSDSDKDSFTARYVIDHDALLDNAFVLAVNEAGDNVTLSTERDLVSIVQNSPLIWNSHFKSVIPVVHLSQDTGDLVRDFVDKKNDLSKLYGFVSKLNLSDYDKSTIFYKSVVLAKKIENSHPGESKGLSRKAVEEYL